VGAPGEFRVTPLLQQGFARNPQFGGAGPVTLDALPAHGVYATLVDNGAGLEVDAALNFVGVSSVLFDTLDVVYLKPFIDAVLPGDFDDDRDVDGAEFLVWQRNVGSPPGTLPNDLSNTTIGAFQLSAWTANFGLMVAGPLTPVPEPGATAMLLALAGATLSLGGARRRRSERVAT
jgi:hypothetical protein